MDKLLSVKPYSSMSMEKILQIPKGRRRYLRLRGIPIPKLKPGPRKGYKQSNDHIAKRIRFGELHCNWKGNAVTEKSGRTRALRQYPGKPCSICRSAKADRHHVDGNTINNSTENIEFLCRRCHMKKDGRLEKLRELARANQPKAVAARWR